MSIQAFDDLARAHAAEMAEAEEDYNALSAERDTLRAAAESAREMLQECMRTAACNDQAETIDTVLQALGAALGSSQAQPPATHSDAAPWHLFRIEATDDDGEWGFMVSAQSASEGKAQELAEAAALEVIGTEDKPGRIEKCIPFGTCNRDIFEKFGPM